MNRVAIIVLNWNGINDTLDCLDSLLLQSYKDFQIIVVDNGSADNSRELLEKYSKKHKKIEVIYNLKNLGFAGGVNTGIKWALKNDFEYVALFNNDAVADKKWLDSLVAAIKPKEIGISTSLLLRRDGKTIDTTGDQYSTWGLPFPRNRNDKVSLAPKNDEFVFGATGGASLYKTDLFRKIGLFDEDFFAYYEDIDISFRAQLAGWKIIFTPKAIAYHKQGATSSKLSGFTVYQTFKNLPILFTKNTPDGLRFSIGIRFYLAYILMLFNAIFKGNGKFAIKGLWKSILLKPRAKQARKQIQLSKCVSNEYIKSILWPDIPPEQTGLRKFRHLFTGKK